MYVLVVLCLIRQVGAPPPIPEPPPPISTISQPYSERDWLTNNLIVDHPSLEKQIRDKMSSLPDEQVHQLADYYRQQVALAKIQLQQVIERRDRLRQEIQDRVRAEKQRITEYGSDLARQQFEWSLQNYYTPNYGYGYPRNYRNNYYRPVGTPNYNPSSGFSSPHGSSSRQNNSRPPKQHHR